VTNALKQMSKQATETPKLKRSPSRQRWFDVWKLELLCGLVPGVWCLFLFGCATVARHEFAQPTSGWQMRTGQLLYRNAARMLIGEAIVRYSGASDFELTFSKGPGVTLLILRQDRSFAEVGGALARRGWLGRIEHAPAQLRGWLALRDKIVQGQNQRSIRVVTNGETFEFRF
jgi:hypothetical protein